MPLEAVVMLRPDCYEKAPTWGIQMRRTGRGVKIEKRDGTRMNTASIASCSVFAGSARSLALEAGGERGIRTLDRAFDPITV
jgi:hypothetical protein